MDEALWSSERQEVPAERIWNWFLVCDWMAGKDG
jgi:hypothetical protein